MKKAALLPILLASVVSSAQEWRDRYDEIGLFENEAAYVCSKGRYGYVDRSGREIVPCEFSFVGSFNDEGLVWVNKGGRQSETSSGIEGGVFGVYNTQGAVVLPVKYQQLGEFDTVRSSDGNPYIKFRTVAGMDYGNSRYSADVENRTFMKNKGMPWVGKGCGRFDVHEPVPFPAVPFSKLDMTVCQCFAFSSNTKNGSISEINGKPVYLDETTRGQNKWGIADATGRILLPNNTYDFCYNPSEGYVPVVKIENGFYTINYYNTQLQQFVFGDFRKTIAVAPVVNGKILLLDDSGCTFYNTDGKRIDDETVYDAVFPSDYDDVYTVFKDTCFGIIKPDGQTVIAPKYKLMSASDNGLISFVDKNAEGKQCYGFMNTSGGIVVPPCYSAIYRFENQKALVRKGKLYGCIDIEGREVLPCAFFKIFPASSPKQDIFFVQEENGSAYYAYRAYTKSRLYETSFVNVRNYSRDFENVAFVGDEEELYGCVSTDGEMLIPLLCSSYEEAMKIYLNRQRDGYLHWTETDTWRFWLSHKVYNQGFGLREKIADEYWNY